MQGLTIDELHALRLQIFNNAEALYKESSLLFEHAHYARAYLLAHFCCEELGKIPIVVGVVGYLLCQKSPDWKRVEKRFYDHKRKIDSDDFHHFTFAIDADLIADRDLRWLKQANDDAPARIDRKNAATYVDVDARKVSSPLEAISKEDATRARERAFASLSAHWQSEKMTNPIAAAALKISGEVSASEVIKADKYENSNE